MRATGVVERPTGLTTGDHLCWAFDARADLAGAASSFLAEGLAAGERVGYFASGSRDELLADLAELPDPTELLERGALVLTPIGHAYAASSDEQVAAYTAAVAGALADGYRGFRVVADCTELVGTDGALDAFVRYEHRMDALMARGLAFTAMCGYDRSRLDQRSVDAAAAIHPLAHGAACRFQVSAHPTGAVTLAGEVDVLCADQLAAALERAASQRAGTLTIDCAELAFLDHRGLLVLEGLGGRRGTPVRLVGARPGARRVVHLVRPRWVEVAP